MDGDGIVPEILDEAPKDKIIVIYPGNVEVHFGKEIAPLQVKDEPSVTWDADPEKYYVLMMVDPDAPSRGNAQYGEIAHWLVVNIKGNDLSTGEVIHPYVGSGPPQGTGLHRYIFILFEQREKMTFSEPKSTATSRLGRLHFSVKRFANKYNLGKPAAGNYYLAQWDLYVDRRRVERLNSSSQ